AVAAHPHLHWSPARVEPLWRQLLQCLHLLGQAPLPSGVAVIKHFAQEALVGLPAREVGAAAQQQRLPDRLLEVTVERLDVAVLVWGDGLRTARLEAVVAHQRLVALRENLRTGVP